MVVAVAVAPIELVGPVKHRLGERREQAAQRAAEVRQRLCDGAAVQRLQQQRAKQQPGRRLHERQPRVEDKQVDGRAGEPALRDTPSSGCKHSLVRCSRCLELALRGGCRASLPWDSALPV